MARGEPCRPLQETNLKQLLLTLRLDQDDTSKMSGYYLHRSEECSGNRPIVDGIYVQRNGIGPIPPETMSVLLKWLSSELV